MRLEDSDLTMRRQRRFSRWVVFVLLMAFPCSASAASLKERAREVARTWMEPWLHDAVVVDGLAEQNRAHHELSRAEVLALDQQWRSELGKIHGQRPLIDEVLSRPLSVFLREKVARNASLIRETMVMDDKGLLAGANRITSDYWQGDEDKWIETFLKHSDVHISEVAKDESTQTYQIQVSFPIFEPGAEEPLGAITVGIDAESLRKGEALD